MNLRKLFKILHTLAAMGYGGGIVAYLFVLMAAPEATELAQHLTLRTSLSFVANWLILPSAVVVVLSGILAMMAFAPYQSMGWVWLKFGTFLLILEGTLFTVGAPAKAAQKAAEAAMSGAIPPEQLAALLHDEWVNMWVLVGLATLNVVLGIWRPRFKKQSRPAQSRSAATVD